MKSFKTYEQKAFADTLAIAEQFKHKIEEILNDYNSKNPNSQIGLDSLPPSVINTAYLYQLVYCYNLLFEESLTNSLIKDAHIKPSGVIH